MPDAARRVPVSTYRLQLHAGFGFAAAGSVADYLAAIGVTDVYLSPVLQAVPGSRHGYDVVDHSRLSDDLGGRAAFTDMVRRFRAHGLGVIVDVVPNHMAVPAPEWLNRQLWSVLADGRHSDCADWFDIDWTALGGRMLLPVLGGPARDCLADLAVGVAGDGAPPWVAPGDAVLRYFDHVLPLRPGTERLPLMDLLDAQHYSLADWRAAARALNWRRFFDVSTLIAVRAEDPGVFAATHGLLLELMSDGLIDGLRVDHPDGLADPRGYLERLAKATGGAWVVAEKILTGGARLPSDWPCAGTTGYDALAMVDGLFHDPAGDVPLTRLYRQRTGGPADFAGVALDAKRQVAAESLAAEVARLARLAQQAGGPALAGVRAGDLITVLTELLASFGVYRAYVTRGDPGERPASQTVTAVTAAARAARGRLPASLHGTLAAVGELVLGRGGAAGPCRDEFVVRFQQTCGPVIAKGVEDTAFYRWSRLVSRNEVGGDPDRLAVSTVEFAAFANRIARDWPATMTTLSTHDTKRQEDARARLAALSEVSREWGEAVERWHRRAAELAGGRSGPEADTEYLLWQTLTGAWPVGAERLMTYLTKAMREAKSRTSWAEPASEYERAVLGYAAAALADPGLTGQIAEFVAAITPAARVNSLGARLVQLTMPGVPDVYQGSELGGFSLVDPDNRRPVDFDRCRALAAAADAGLSPGPGQSPAAIAGDRPGHRDDCTLAAEKLLVMSRALRLRRAHPDLFTGSYAALACDGPAAAHAVAFARGGRAVTLATRLPTGLLRAGGWRGTSLCLPAAGEWLDVLTGTAHDGPRVSVAALTARLPVALLVPAELARGAAAAPSAAAAPGAAATPGAAGTAGP